MTSGHHGGGAHENAGGVVATWLECDVTACDREVLASRALEFGWVVDDVDTLCPTHFYLSSAHTRLAMDQIDVRARAAGEDADAW